MNTLKAVKQVLTKQRILICISGLFAVGSLSYLLLALYYFVSRPKWGFACFAYMTVFLLIAFFFYKKFKKVEDWVETPYYEQEAKDYLVSMSDRYTKRRLNSIALLVGAIFIYLFAELSFFVFGNSKPDELVEMFLSNILVLEIPAFLLIKNTLYSKMFQRRAAHPDAALLRKHCLGIAGFSLAFWLIVTAVVFALREKLVYPGNWFIGAGVIFAGCILAYNLTLRREVTYVNIAINVPRLISVSIVILLLIGNTILRRDTFYTQPYINSVPIVSHNLNKISYNDETGVYTITAEKDDFKILHLTDIHLGGSLYSYRKDLKALKACYAEIEHTHPDFVIVTGDMSFPMGIMSLSLNNTAPVGQFAAFMRNIGIPWAFTYGNHDTEAIASAKDWDLNELYKSLSFKTSGTLLYPYVQPDIKGRNNQLIELRNADGTLNTALFLIDSNAYTGNGLNEYDYIHDDQVEWYANEVKRLNAEEGHTIESLVFFHIPLQQYRTAYELYEAGSDEVKYYFGENNEKMIDKVCCSDYPSKLFDTMVELGSTTGTFCGHDHYNNMSLEYQGIRLTYGMSIDYLAMPGIEDDTEQRGAELITIHKDGSWNLEQIPLTFITN
jgi:hypothetical protein